MPSPEVRDGVQGAAAVEVVERQGAHRVHPAGQQVAGYL